MFCRKCGCDLPSNAMFCTRCGAPQAETGSPVASGTPNTKKPSLLWVFIAAGAVLALVVVVLLFSPTGNAAPNIERLLLEADAYMLDDEYEEALLIYEQIIEIEPKQANAYIGMSKAYMALEDADSARAMLDNALQYVDEGDVAAIEQVRTEMEEVLAQAKQEPAEPEQEPTEVQQKPETTFEGSIQILGLPGLFAYCSDVSKSVWFDSATTENIATYTAQCQAPDDTLLDVSIIDELSDEEYIVSRTVLINGASVSTQSPSRYCWPNEATVLDLDVTDDTVELIVYSSGEEEDEWYEVYHWDGQTVTCAGTMDVNGESMPYLVKNGIIEFRDSLGDYFSEFECLMTNGEGLLVWSSCEITDPFVAFDYYRLNGGMIEQIIVDESIYVGQTLTLQACELDFKVCEYSLDPYDSYLDEVANGVYREPYAVSAGQKMTIIKANDPVWLYVDIDGVKGYLYMNVVFLG